MTKRKKAMYPADNRSIQQIVSDAFKACMPAPVTDSLTADMASIEAALQGIVDVETMDKISDLVVRAPAAQVVGMLALAKLIKEGRA